MTEVICNSGLETIAKAVNGVAGMTAYTYMALGTSTTITHGLTVQAGQ